MVVCLSVGLLLVLFLFEAWASFFLCLYFSLAKGSVLPQVLSRKYYGFDFLRVLILGKDQGQLSPRSLGGEGWEMPKGLRDVGHRRVELFPNWGDRPGDSAAGPLPRGYRWPGQPPLQW